MELINKYTNVWEATDGSGLIFNSAKKPERVRVVVLETMNSASPSEGEIELAGLRHLRSVTCHDRPSGLGEGTTWGSNTIYTIYRLDHGWYEARTVISRMSGFGPQFYGHGGHTSELFDALCQSLTEHQLWDVLDMLIRTYNHATDVSRQREFRRLAEAFVDGRLVKRKVRGANQVEVKVKPVMPKPGPDGSVAMEIGLGPIPGVPALVR